jgi:hypothetical protein
MTPERWQRVCELFAELMRRDPADRQALLQEKCADDPELRAQVELLLAEDEQADRRDFLKSPPAADPDHGVKNPIRKILGWVNFRAREIVPPKGKAGEQPPGKRNRLFEPTNWGLIAAAKDGDTSKARNALAELCQAYWYPLYAYIRRQGYSPDQAQDLTPDRYTREIRNRFSFAVGGDPVGHEDRNILVGKGVSTQVLVSLAILFHARLRYPCMNNWIDEELATLDLGDDLLNRRQKLILDRFADRPSASIPGACRGWAETNGA